MRMYGLKLSTSIERNQTTVVVGITCPDEQTAEMMVEVLRRRQQHGALTLDLSRPAPSVIEGRR